MRDMGAGVPILGVIGPNGIGKTLVGVQSCLVDMKNGRPVVSTVAIESPWGNSEPVRSLEQLLHLRNTTVFLDEVSVIFSSRSSNSLPAQMDTALQTVRHNGNRYIWTAPGWMRADNRLREVTQGVISVQPFIRGTPDHSNPWPRPRMVMATLFDTSVGKTDSVPTKVLRRRFLVPGRMDSFGTYDTYADTPQLGVSRFSTKCECGGKPSAELPPLHSAERHAALGIPWYGDSPRASEETTTSITSLTNEESTPAEGAFSLA